MSDFISPISFLEEFILNKKKAKNVNKTEILLQREKVLDAKEKQLDETIQEYQELISEVKELKQKYLDTVKGVNEIKLKYEKEMETQLQRIRKQKYNLDEAVLPLL